MQHEMQHENKKPRDFGVFYMEVMGLEPKKARFQESFNVNENGDFD